MQPIYVEVSDEITTVVERMKAAGEADIALVIPKGAILLQSIVNLKLAKKAAADNGKNLTLVTTDKIGRNLAAQVGLPVISKLGETVVSEEIPEQEATVIDGVKIRRYYDEEESSSPETAEAPAIKPIVPREILKKKEPEEEPLAPIVVREIETGPLPPSPKKVPVLTEDPLPPQTSVPPLPAEPATPPAATPLPPSKKEPKPLRRKLFFLTCYLLLLGLLGAVGVGAFYLPKTTVTVTLASTPWKKELTTLAKVGDQTLAAELLSSEVQSTVQYKATGSKDVGEAAKGTAKIFNADSSDSQALPAGTVIMANGLKFHTTQAIRVPGARVESGQLVAGSTTVDIAADQSGTSSNMKEAPATLPGKKFYAQIVSTSGGTSKEIAIVTETDIANARATLTKQAREEADGKMTANLQNRTVLFDEKTDTYSLTAFSSSAIAGTATDTFQVTGTGILKRLVVDKTAAEKAVQEELAKSQESRLTYALDSLEFTKVEVEMETNQISLTSLSQGKVSESLDTAQLRKELVGKKRAAGESILTGQVDNGTIVINQTPTWWPIHNFPYSDKYLQIQVAYE